MKLWLRTLILGWLGISDHDERLKDIERHFVTKRDESGVPTETLADVPVEKRKDLKKSRMAGMSWPQQKRYLEATDGGRRAAVGDRLPSNS
jgi:hypothetical protein